jgi:hypothetical protein
VLRVDADAVGAGTGVLRVAAAELDAGTGVLRVGAAELDAGTGVLRVDTFAIGSGAGVLGPSTDQPSARFAIRPSVSSLRGTGVGRPPGGGALVVLRRALVGSDPSSGSAPPGSAPMFGVALISDAARALVAPLAAVPAACSRPLASLPVRGFVRPLVRCDSPDAVRAGSVAAGGDGRAGRPVRVGAGVATGVAGGSSPGDSTDQPDARSAIRLLVSSPSRRRVRSSSGTHRP